MSRFHECIVNDPLCGICGDVCDFCRDEIVHRRQVELARARNEGAAAERERRIEVYQQMDPTAAAVGVGIIGLGYGIAAVASAIRERRAEKKAAKVR